MLLRMVNVGSCSMISVPRVSVFWEASHDVSWALGSPRMNWSCMVSRWSRQGLYPRGHDDVGGM